MLTVLSTNACINCYLCVAMDKLWKVPLRQCFIWKLSLSWMWNGVTNANHFVTKGVDLKFPVSFSMIWDIVRAAAKDRRSLCWLSPKTQTTAQQALEVGLLRKTKGEQITYATAFACLAIHSVFFCFLDGGTLNCDIIGLKFGNYSQKEPWMLSRGWAVGVSTFYDSLEGNKPATSKAIHCYKSRKSVRRAAQTWCNCAGLL